MKTDEMSPMGGVEVQRIFYKLRPQTIEPFNRLFKDLFGRQENMPINGLVKCQLLVPGAIFLYQPILFYRNEEELEVGKGIKAILKAA